MPKSRFTHARVAGLVTSVPYTEKRFDEEADRYGGDPKQMERIRKTIGLDRRRVVRGGTTAGDLCLLAARRLLEGAGADPGAVDAIVCVTQTADYSQPCNAAVLHGRLGLRRDCAGYDVNLGCSGYVYGLWLAHMMVEAGGCERVLLLAGDTISRLVHPADRAVAPLFGDGGSATLVLRDEEGPEAAFALETDGTGFDQLIVPAGGARRPASEETKVETEDEGGNRRTPENLFMDGAGIFNFSIQEEPRAVRELCAYAGISVEALDSLVFHQANRYILGNIAKRLKVDPAKVPMQTVERYGNQSSASIPCALCGELREALAGGRPQRLLLSGFGVGLSVGSAILELGGLPVCEIVEEPEPEDG